MSMQSIYLMLSGSGLIYLAGLDTYGLYIAIAIFWVIAAFYKPLTKLAIWSIVLFMAGFAVMRIGNILINGLSDVYYLGLLLVEIVLSLIGIWLANKPE
jgi:hypothetical protein